MKFSTSYINTYFTPLTSAKQKFTTPTTDQHQTVSSQPAATLPYSCSACGSGKLVILQLLTQLSANAMQTLVLSGCWCNLFLLDNSSNITILSLCILCIHSKHITHLIGSCVQLFFLCVMCRYNILYHLAWFYFLLLFSFSKQRKQFSSLIFVVLSIVQ